MIGHKNNRTKGTNNAPIPEDNEQYCFRMPLKLEVHKRYCCTRIIKCDVAFNLTIVSNVCYEKQISWSLNKGEDGFTVNS